MSWFAPAEPQADGHDQGLSLCCTLTAWYSTQRVQGLIGMLSQ
jgi:hypothetical protein